MKISKISIIVPAYNEEGTIAQVINRLKKLKLPLKKEIIIVDDGSTDKTRKIINKIQGIKTIFQEKNQGKGASIIKGIKNSDGEIIAIQDADLEYDPQDYIKLLGPILKEEVKVVYGSRFKDKHIKRDLFYYGNKFLSLLTSWLYLSKITDMETCYKVFKREILKDITLKAKRFDFEPEITSKILKRGYKIKEIPISYNPRSKKEGKKIKIRDGFSALSCLLKYRLID